MTRDPWERLAELCAGNDLPWSDTWIEPLSTVVRTVARFNAKTNLVGDSTADGVINGHIVETLALAAAVQSHGALPANVIDVGAGGGLESLTLAIVWPQCRVWAVEPRRKRADFIELAADRVGVGGRVAVERTSVTRTTARQLLERSRQPPRWPAVAAFDLATSRATFAPADWLAIATRLITNSGLAAVHAHATVPTHGESLRCAGRSDVPKTDRCVWLFTPTSSP